MNAAECGNNKKTPISFWRNDTLCFCISNSLGQCTSGSMIYSVIDVKKKKSKRILRHSEGTSDASSESIPTSQHFVNKQSFLNMFPPLVYFTRNFCEVLDIVQVVCRSCS